MIFIHHTLTFQLIQCFQKSQKSVISFDINHLKLFFLLYLYFWQMISEMTESIISSPELQQLQSKFKEITHEMEQLAREGKYSLAETCRVNAQKIKKELQVKKISQVQKRQKKENIEVKTILKDQLQGFNKEWDSKMNEFSQKGKKWISDLKQKQSKEMEEGKEKLQKEISQKWKESSQCLNLRKIEDNLAKQQNYVEALKVQKLLRQMEKKQQESWLDVRKEKIQSGLEQIRAKQDIEMKALQKRVESGKSQLELERMKAEAKLVLKHSNVSKDIQSQNKKQFLATKGDLKSRVDVLSPSRSRLVSPNRSKLLLSMTR